MSKTNESITMKGSHLRVVGASIKEGGAAPKFKLTGNDMSDVTSDKFAGKVMIVVAVPSLDTPVCSIEAARFNHDTENLGDGVATIVVSRDLPFAQKRWCGAEGVTRLTTLSDFKYRTFGEQFGVELPDLGLLARAVFVVDKAGKVAYVEYVTEVASEPDYKSALAAASSLIG